MKTIKILIISMVFLSTAISVAKKTWSNNKYTFNNDGGGDKMYLNIDDNTANSVEFTVGSGINRMYFRAPNFQFDGHVGVAHDLDVSAGLKVNGTINAKGALNVTDALNVGGALNANDALNVKGVLNATHALNVTDALNANGPLNVKGTLKFSQTLRQMIDLWDGRYGIGIQDKTQYFRKDSIFDFRKDSIFGWYKGGVHSDIILDPGGGIALMVLNDNGRLGVGVSNPSEKLEVKGYAKLSNGASNYLRLGHGGSDSFIDFNGAGNLEFKNNNKNLLTLKPNGTMQINSSANGALTIRTEDNRESNGIAFQNSGNLYTWNIFRENVGSNNADLVFASGLEKEASDLHEKFRITKDGKVGIGIGRPIEKLEVAGNVKANGVYVSGDGANTNTIDSNIDGTIVFGGEDGSTLTDAQIADSFYPNFAVWVEEGIVTEDIAVAPSSDWDGLQPDYVFETDYELPTLEAVESYVKQNKHLEGIPSKAEVAEKGWSLPGMDQKLLKKIEELTLYAIHQEKEIKALKAMVDELTGTIKN